MPPKKPATPKTAARKPAARKPALEKVERVKVNKLRTLGDVAPDAKKQAKPREVAMAKKARELLEAEFEHALRMKDTLAAEAKVGGKEKGRDPTRANDKLRGVIASLEGANRFALKMGLITPAESREMYAAAMKRGLHDGVR